MIIPLMLRGLRRGKARMACAVAGIAIAAGTMVFTTSLVATNNAQAPAAAEKASAPWSAWTVNGTFADADLEMETIRATVDFRPGGRVLQGPPMRALIGSAPEENPYASAPLAEGRWVDLTSSEPEVVAVKSLMRRFGKEYPPLGSEVKFVGRAGTMTAKIVGYMEGERLPREFPFVFANKAAMDGFAGERAGKIALWRAAPEPGEGILTPLSESVINAFKSDEQRRMDYATPLLVIAAILTAVSLLVNSLLISIESNRRTLSILRTVGLTRMGVVGFVASEALFASVCGWVIGVGAALGSLYLYVAADPSAFSSGMAIDFSRIWTTLAAIPAVAFAALLFALRPALKLRPAETLRSRKARWGMAMTFAFGFAAFVAVEVWGASLMRAFVPSPEWPDAIVSLLPAGASSFDVEKLRGIEGVKRISELVPRQLKISGTDRSNALFLAAEWLPEFNFMEGDHESAAKELLEGDNVVITEMMSRAYGLHKGDSLKVEVSERRGPARGMEFNIAGVVDLNWHMVTSRGLVRGLNGAPGMTDGPVFCSLDTMGAIDPRTYIVEPAFSAPMTHLWVEYEPAFLESNGVFPAGRLVEAAIAKRLGDPKGITVRLHARDEIADGTLAHGSDVIGQAARVPFVFLAILSIGFVAMLVAEAERRKEEFATLHAVGATRFQLVMKLASTAIKTALKGIAIGLPLGSLAGWLFSIGTGSRWPGLPHWFVLPSDIVAEGAAGALLFALFFSLPAAALIVMRATRR